MYFSEKKYVDMTIYFKKAMNIFFSSVNTIFNAGNAYKNIIYLKKE